MMTRHGYGVATSMTSELRARAPQSSAEDLLEIDRRHVWHPYGPMPAATPPLPVVSAPRACACAWPTARELVDGMASWWCAIHGYRHPALDAAAHDQLGRWPT